MKKWSGFGLTNRTGSAGPAYIYMLDALHACTMHMHGLSDSLELFAVNFSWQCTRKKSVKSTCLCRLLRALAAHKKTNCTAGEQEGIDVSVIHKLIRTHTNTRSPIQHKYEKHNSQETMSPTGT